MNIGYSDETTPYIYDILAMLLRALPREAIHPRYKLYKLEFHSNKSFVRNTILQIFRMAFLLFACMYRIIHRILSSSQQYQSCCFAIVFLKFTFIRYVYLEGMVCV